MKLRYPETADDRGRDDQKIVYGNPINKSTPSYYDLTQLDNSKFDVKQGKINHLARTPVKVADWLSDKKQGYTTIDVQSSDDDLERATQGTFKIEKSIDAMSHNNRRASSVQAMLPTAAATGMKEILIEDDGVVSNDK